MSIVKMKRLRIFGMASDCEELLRKLQHLGCVELRAPTQPSSDPGWQGFTAKSDGELANAQLRMDEFRTTLERLKRCSPTNKKGRFPSRPRITERELFDRQIVLEAEETVERVAALEKSATVSVLNRTSLSGRERPCAWLGWTFPGYRFYETCISAVRDALRPGKSSGGGGRPGRDDRALPGAMGGPGRRAAICTGTLSPKSRGSRAGCLKKLWLYRHKLSRLEGDRPVKHRSD